MTEDRKMNGNGHSKVISFADRELAAFKAKLNRELTPRMRRWQVALELIENGYWPLDPQFELLDTALDVVLAIRDDSMNAVWLSLRALPEAEKERELDQMARNPKLRLWLELYKSNIAKAEATKKEWAKRRASAS